MVRIPLHEGSAAQVQDRAATQSPLPDLFGFPASQPAGDGELTITRVSPALTNPLTGEIVDETSIDELIDCYEYIDAKDKQIFAVKQRIKHLLLARTEGSAATRRVAGERRVAKLTLPAESFEQATLKRLWAEMPDLAEKYLRIESIAVQMREFNKLRGTSTDQPDLAAFRDALTAASRGRASLPSVSVEK